MTISEAITECDELKPNQYSDTHKLRWLTDIEKTIMNEIILTHEREIKEGGEETGEFNGYDEDTDYETELIAPDPYSQLYVFYLMAMIDFYNGETTKYQNSYVMFNAKYQEFANYWNRTHKTVLPKRMGGEGIWSCRH